MCLKSAPAPQDDGGQAGASVLDIAVQPERAERRLHRFKQPARIEPRVRLGRAAIGEGMTAVAALFADEGQRAQRSAGHRRAWRDACVRSHVDGR